MDDWDSVSNDTPPNSATDPWDAVSTPDLAAAMERRRRRQQGQSIEEEEPQVTPFPMPESDILSTGEPLEQPAPVLDTATVPERAFQQAQPEDEIKEAPRREPEARAARAPVKRGGLKGSFIAIVVLSLAVIGLSVLTGLNLYLGVLTHNGNVKATATVQTKATNRQNADSIATVRALIIATAQEQLYNQATSGTPAFNDPLSDDRNNWGLFTTNWGGRCAFTGGAYHLTLSKQGYVIWCTSGIVNNLNNFALQIEVTIVQGDYSSIVFGQNTNGAYSIDIHPNAIYALYQQFGSNQPPKNLIYGPSAALKQGLNQPNIITIIVNNGSFYFYANQQLLTSDYLSNYVAGNIDLAAVSFNQAPTDIAYSNLKLWTL